ncbi:Protein of unknown function [Lactobacillus acidophilus DSM 9126]|nr:Protein of unknown function [Lactobacillus acidophilus DSM 20079 = JCM 1132 = NBRC 13951 = CIP 76.13]CDF69706.1 Protein of unknown function [Lactobacillus acidophilus CIRM-BIA 442]CDF71505.1 Protein of unknown function [Lactobacillus acidophilus CIRM-BIA 445]CDF73332.1 Protein of unknown function [Lactobacillus acidophilus DSM 9126]CDF75324.1 Protein of unknown function [Lactobacillus acidophilus DSM 20242]
MAQNNTVIGSDSIYEIIKKATYRNTDQEEQINMR